MLPARYLIAFFAASTVVLCGVLFCLHTRRLLVHQFRETALDPAKVDAVSPELKAAAEAGTLPTDVGLEVSPSLMRRMAIADWLAGYWPVWILLVFGMSFGLACYLGRSPESP